MELFKRLAVIHSPSLEEEKMVDFISDWVGENVPEAGISWDLTGNVYIRKGQCETYPCVVAHLDQVQKPYPKDYKVQETSKTISAYSKKPRMRCGLGADDKCGIWIALKMLLKHPVMKVAFFVGEECGCIGSSKADMEFFNDVRFVIEPDRRGHSDLITCITSPLCSKEFIKDIKPEQFGYTETTGLMTDVDELKTRGLGVSCINLSCGYYQPHTNEEFVDKQDLNNCRDFVDWIITNCTKVYEHVAEPVDWSHETTPGDYEDWEKYWTGKYEESPQLALEMTQEDWEQYWQQLDEAYELLCYETDCEQKWTAKQFMDTYGGTFDLLTVSDVDRLIKDIDAFESYGN